MKTKIKTKKKKNQFLKLKKQLEFKEQ